MQRNMTCTEMVEAVGGSRAIADEFGLPITHVSMWRVRGIPERYRHRFVALAERKRVRGITLETVTAASHRFFLPKTRRIYRGPMAEGAPQK